MKNRLLNSARFIPAALCLWCFLLANHAGAYVLYWDPDGPTQNGSTGTWDTTSFQWSPFTSLQASPVAWTNADAACFCAGTTPGYTGDLTISVNSAITMAGIYNGSLTPPGCTLTITGTGSLNIASGVTAALSTGGSDNDPTYVYVPFTGPGILEPEGHCNCYLYGMNTHSGGTILGQTGILYFTNAAAFGTGPITLLASGGALELNGSSAVTITNAVTAASVSLNIVGNPAGLTFSGPWDLGTTTPTLGTGNTPGNLVIISGVISGSGGLSLFDYGTLELTATNFYNGLTTNSTATLQLGDGVSRNGVVAGNIANNATLIFANPYPQTYSYLHAGIISGTGSLTKQGAGVLTLQGPNTYTGATTLSAGTLQVDYAEVPGTSGPLGASAAANAGSIVLSGGTLQYSSANKNDYSGRFSASSSAYNIDVNGQTVTFATSFTSSGAPLTLSDSKGGGKLTLSAANTYSGGTTVSAGTLDASVNGALGSGNVTVASGATLELDASGAINSAAELILNPGAPHVFLNYSGTNTIHAISLDGGATDGVAGVYGANGGANNPGGVFTGTGFLNVTTGSSAILSVTPNGGNSFTLKLVGTYQAQYYLVAQTNVAEPMANWHAVPGSTNTVTNPSGLWYVIVTNRAPAFYRARAM